MIRTETVLTLKTVRQDTAQAVADFPAGAGFPPLAKS
jgi:hypothetical protein